MLRGFLFIGFSLSTTVNATLFQCEDATGRITFSDAPCVNALTLTYKGQVREASQKPTAKKQRKKKSQEKIDRALQAERRALERAKKKQAQQIKKLAKRQIKRELHCQQIQHRIKMLRVRQQQGYTPQQAISIQNQLTKQNLLYKKYCLNE